MTPGKGPGVLVFEMPLDAIELNTIDDLYTFVETAIQRTGLVLAPDAFFSPWVRAVSAQCHDVRWLYLSKPISGELQQHLANFAHKPLPDKGFVLLEMGRVVRVVDVDAIGGSSQPHRLGAVVQQAFAVKPKSAANGRYLLVDTGSNSVDPYQVLGAAESDSESNIKKKYKQMVLQYHPDRVAHLGPELRELAAKKTREINAAFAAIRSMREF